MYCKSCGKQINDDSLFCSYCGTKMESQSPSSPVATESIEEISRREKAAEPFVDEMEDDTVFESEGESADQTNGICEEQQEELQVTPIHQEERSSADKKHDRLYKTSHDKEKHESDDAFGREDIYSRRGRIKIGPLTGMTKAALTLLVVWTAAIGIILVRYNLNAQNAREAAIAAKEQVSEGMNSGTEVSSQIPEQEVEASAEQTVEEPKVSDQLTFRCLFKNATGWDQIIQITAYLVPGFDSPMGEGAIELSYAQDGYLVSTAPSGQYTLCWHADGYYDGYENVTIGENRLDMEKNLIPIVTDVRNCTIMLEWNGDRDLDLCLYDAHSQSYMNILNPISNGNFLFEDTTSNRRCEVIRIADCTQSQVYTVYVRDDNLLRNIASENTISMMERDGVSITVATAGGIIAHKIADPGFTSALWNPIYIYEAQVFDIDNYITDYSNEAWAFYDKTVR